VQNGAFLGDVDLLTMKHGVDPLPQAGLIREIKQQTDRLIGDAVFGVVEVETYSLKREVLGTLGIIREQLAEMQVLYLSIMLPQSLPKWVARATE
jgi:hypothetical protein